MKKLSRILPLIMFPLLMIGQAKLYRQDMTEGNLLFLEKNYPMALHQYLDAYAIDSTNANIKYKIGMCFLNMTTGKNLSVYFLNEASKDVSKRYDEFNPMEKHAPLIAIYYLAQAYHLNDNFNEAITSFTNYKDQAGPNESDRREVGRSIDKSLTGIELTENPIQLKFINLGDSINTEYPEYSAVVSGNDSLLIFTSRRPGSTGGEKTMDDQYYEDIYYSRRNVNGAWSKAKPISNKVNTNDNERSLCLSYDGKQLILYKESNGGDLYVSNFEDNQWTSPVSMGSDINSKYDENGAALSTDGKIFFFSSNRPGGYGGSDIYFCKKLPNGDWGLARNIGAVINTPYDETSPAIFPDGKDLFFSSEGHAGMGGSDIFRSTKIGEDDYNWSVPANVGYPISSSGDDIHFGPVMDANHAYFSCIRDGGAGDLDIYSLVTEKSLNEALPVLSEVVNSNDPLINLTCGKERGCKQFPSIFFDFEKATLRENAKPELDTIAAYLTANEELKVEIYGHTDSKGEDSYNYKLSLKRAQAASDYFSSKGINVNRIKGSGKGEKFPLEPNENPDHSDNPEGRQMNRRVEFKVLESENEISFY